MEKTIISEGKTSAEAIEKGLKILNISKDEAEIKILEEKKKSFFSILDPHIVKVEISKKETTEIKNENKCREIKEEHNEEISKEVLEKAKEQVDIFLKEFLKNISKNIEYKIKIENESIYVEIGGEDSSKLIGYRGEALNSLQLIISNVIKNRIEQSVKIIIDVENYREKREKTLKELAKKLEKTVLKNNKALTLEPMSPYERKIIHTELQDSKDVKTYSVGEGDHRRVVISKK